MASRGGQDDVVEVGHESGFNKDGEAISNFTTDKPGKDTLSCMYNYKEVYTLY